MTQFMLHGKKIVVTRAEHQASEFVNRLREIGATPILFPCIAIAPPHDTTPLDTQLDRLDLFDWLIFTSPNTVRIVHQQLSQLSLTPDWKNINIAAVGSKTAQTVADIFGQDVDFVPSDYTAQALAQTLPNVNSKHILLPQSELADDSLAQALIERGAEVTSVVAYSNTIGSGGDDVPTMLRQNQIDMVTFTSSSTVENFLKRIAPQPVPDIPALCIGPSTAETATSYGFGHILIPDDYTLDGMIDRLRQFYSVS